MDSYRYLTGNQTDSKDHPSWWVDCMSRFPQDIAATQSQQDMRHVLFRTVAAKKDKPTCVSKALKTLEPFCVSTGPVTFKQCVTLTRACEVCDTYARENRNSDGLLAAVTSGIMDPDPRIAAKMLWPLLTASEADSFVHLLQRS
jgi:hypothetical protein